jgi:hypothetical protein
MMSRKKWFLSLVACSLAMPTQAARLADMDVEVAGYFTAGVVTSDNDRGEFLQSVGEEFAFDVDSVLGLRLDVQVDEKTSVALQVRASGRDTDDSLEVDWAYVGYQLNDEILVRGGRIAFPAFMISEMIEVGYAYPWIRPPVEVYGQVPFTSMYGGDLLYRVNWADIDWTVQPFIGQERDVDSQMGLTTFNAGVLGFQPGTLDVTLDNEGIYGLNLMADVDWATFRVGYSIGSDATATTPAFFPAAGLVQGVKVSFFNAGMNFDWNNIVGYSEFTRAKLDGLYPDTTAWYVTLGYRMGDLMPHVTFADVSTDDNSPLAPEQDSVTLGLRYEVSDSSALKVEWQRLKTDSGLFGNAGFSFSNDPGDSVNVISVAFDVVF